jgi:ADP-ribosylation factor 1/2
MGCPIFKSKYLPALPDVVKKKIVIVGLESSGKSTILNYFKFKQFIPEVQPTLGVSIETLIHENLELLIFDISGKVRSLWSHYYENLDALIMVIDIGSANVTETFEEIKEEMQKLNEELLKIRNYRGFIMVLWNKIDLLGKQEFEENFSQIADGCGINEIVDLDVLSHKVSGKTGEGLDEAFKKLVDFLKVNEKGGGGLNASDMSLLSSNNK